MGSDILTSDKEVDGNTLFNETDDTGVDLLIGLVKRGAERVTFLTARQEILWVWKRSSSIEKDNSYIISSRNEWASNIEIPDAVNEDELRKLEQKLRGIFLQFNESGKGFLLYDEFREFIGFLNLTSSLGETEIRQIFNSMKLDPEDRLTFDNFFQFFSKLIQGDDPDIIKAATQEASAAYAPNRKAQLKIALFRALLVAERDGKCPLNGVTQYINKHWASFNNFIRAGASQRTVMTGGENIADVLPGVHTLSDLIKWPDNLTETIEPEHVTVKVSESTLTLKDIISSVSSPQG